MGEDQTNDRIKDLIPQGVIDPLTRLVLTNAIYFKGDWVKQFDKKDTQERDFTTSTGNTVKAQMMSLTHDQADINFNYTETDEAQVLELPYSGNELSMLIILPKSDLSSLESSLSSDKLKEWRSNLTSEKVDQIYLPKFKFDTKYFMADTLSAMGMPTAFSSGADFSGMDGTKSLFISSVIHQAFVEVNEEGTEAAAATAVIVGETAAPIQNIIFNADHPFLFIIQQRDTGNILFLGRVTNPLAQ